MRPHSLSCARSGSTRVRAQTQSVHTHLHGSKQEPSRRTVQDANRQTTEEREVPMCERLNIHVFQEVLLPETDWASLARLCCVSNCRRSARKSCTPTSM